MQCAAKGMTSVCKCMICNGLHRVYGRYIFLIRLTVPHFGRLLDFLKAHISGITKAEVIKLVMKISVYAVQVKFISNII